jgi:hypothetical protein
MPSRVARERAVFLELWHMTTRLLPHRRPHNFVRNWELRPGPLDERHHERPRIGLSPPSLPRDPNSCRVRERARRRSPSPTHGPSIAKWPTSPESLTSAAFRKHFGPWAKQSSRHISSACCGMTIGSPIFEIPHCQTDRSYLTAAWKTPLTSNSKSPGHRGHPATQHGCNAPPGRRGRAIREFQEETFGERTGRLGTDHCRFPGSG